MKGWKPTTSQYDSLYDQLFYRYFEHPTETERYISKLSDHHPLIWIPPNWFEHTEPLPSGRMGQVYLSQCRFPWRTKKLIVREINLCLALNVKYNKNVASFIYNTYTYLGQTSFLSKRNYWHHCYSI